MRLTSPIVVWLLTAVVIVPACDGGEDSTWAGPSKGGSVGATGGSSGGPCAVQTCASAKAECGALPDGCGSVLSCGGCAEGETCGGDGPNRCGSQPCTPQTCAKLGASCGYVANGCGDVLDCSDCPSGSTCSDSTHQCVSSADAGSTGGNGGSAGNGACTPSEACSDGNACTKSDYCNAESKCVGGSSVSCDQPANECLIPGGECDSVTGKCSYSAKASGIACSDEGNPCTIDQCDGAGECKHVPKADGSPCGSGTCTSGTCSAGCSGGVTLSWKQSQPAWNGNTNTAGQYSCSGTVPAGTYPSGSTASPSLVDASKRIGSATASCENGAWKLADATCDGRVVDTLIPVECNVSAMAHPRSLFGGWYLGDLYRCADTAGLDYWVSQYGSTCNAPYPNGASTKDECFHLTFLEAAEQAGECSSQSSSTGHVCDSVLSTICPAGAQYPWASIPTAGNKCKYAP